MVRLLKRSILLSFCSFLLLFFISNLVLFHIPATRRQQYLLATDSVVSAIDQIRNADESVLPNQSTAILEPEPGLNCQKNGHGLFLLLMVISAPENVKRRELIRNVFGEMQGRWEEMFWEARKASMRRTSKLTEQNGRNSNVTRVFQVLFFVGQSAKNGMSEDVRGEWERNGDVIVDDLHESYLNLTVKTLRMLKWVLHNCGEASYLVKMDDDVFLHLPRLFQFLLGKEEEGENNNPAPGRKLVAGHRYNQVSVDRDPRSKWFTPERVYKPEKFPPFVAGFCYILGREAMKEMFEESRAIPLFHLEDVFLTGLVASKMLHYELEDEPGGEIVTMMLWYHQLKSVGWAMQHVIIHEVSPEQFRCLTRLTTSQREIPWIQSLLPLFIPC